MAPTIHLRSTLPLPVSSSRSRSCSSSSQDSSNEEDWNDWIENANEPCVSLFDPTLSFPTPEKALQHDLTTHGVDFVRMCGPEGLGLDGYARIRIVNWIRKNHASPGDVQSLKGTEPWFTSDEYLIPVIQNDPLLRMGSDEWSDDDDDDEQGQDPQKRIRGLEKKLKEATQRMDACRTFITDRLVGSSEDPSSSSSSQQHPTRDDDTHYFQSYGEHDIHAIMIQDQVRTSTYASFILRNPSLFANALVLDVGCGTGILSLFAAKAGARKVIAVDASSIADHAVEIVRRNGLEDVITVVKGKIEDVDVQGLLGGERVDVLVSEWMGYALLYESMLDSVLVARDRWLKRDTGVMAPSWCRLMLALADAADVLRERVGFWDDVYGFDLSSMSAGHYSEAIITTLAPSALLSPSACIKDLPLHTLSPSHLAVRTPFTLHSTAPKRTKLTSFVLYFDAFFTARRDAVVREGEEGKVVREHDMLLAEVWAPGGRDDVKRRRSLSVGKAKAGPRSPSASRRPQDQHHDEEQDGVSVSTSFSTGPKSMPTHWKQTVLLLKEPVWIVEGSVVRGQFFMRKSVENSRELDVEVHYRVYPEGEGEGEEEEGDWTVGMWKVR